MVEDLMADKVHQVQLILGVVAVEVMLVIKGG